MADREPYKWITVKGKHIPVYKDEHGDDVFGVGSITKKRVDQKDLTEQKIQEEIVGKSSYMLTPEYRELSKEAGKLFDKIREAEEKRREIDEMLESETIRKPKEEWTDDDKISMLLGFGKPVEYTKHGKELKEYRDRWDKLAKEYKEAWHKVTDRIKEIDAAHAEISRADWLQSKDAEKVSTHAQEEYFGFKRSETTTPYIDEKIKSGEAMIWSMSPKAYIQEAAYNIFENSTVEKTLRGRSAQTVAKYMTMMEQGVKFDTPYLNYEDKQQEGLHRAIAAYMLGLEEIPVVVVPRKRRGY